jgi:anti-sigma factor ChrR (cupin superfamily)
MLINADLCQRATIALGEYQWVSSRQTGVERVMLDRIGAETARATSLVRYAAGSCFPEHSHPGGEEILVLSGTFTEGEKSYPAGWYMRSPPGSSHAPSSAPGATIFVKLWQMPETESGALRIDTNDPSTWSFDGDGREVCPLFASDHETVRMERLTEGERVLPAAPGGAEIFILEGELAEEGNSHSKGTWLRFPAGSVPQLVSTVRTVIYLKTGHLKAASDQVPR